ncbi:hypothetical protein ACFVIN_00850 [Streptomyces prasinus]|uniref:hypothetical protein n=1 Tax=Streptomyces prasinus TaxID=67345 RepID=UPI0036433BBE
MRCPSTVGPTPQETIRVDHPAHHAASRPVRSGHRSPVTDHDNRHAVHVRIGRHFELRLYLSPTVLAALLGGGTTTALAIVLAR